MKSVDVLVRRDAADNARRVDLRRQWQLHEYAVHRGIGVELLHKREQVGFAGIGRKLMIERPHAGFEQGARLAGDIGFAGGIVADENHGQPRHQPVRGGDAARLGRDLSAQIGGDGFAVNNPAVTALRTRSV